VIKTRKYVGPVPSAAVQGQTDRQTYRQTDGQDAYCSQSGRPRHEAIVLRGSSVAETPRDAACYCARSDAAAVATAAADDYYYDHARFPTIITFS